ncbi:hypothetical protein QBC45DRAFT_463673 [Copromyces sp. CBS 386.78]|nr:hypothetical protein QBC45DRAFT_463673 [Copromyces sp. CBS 386.78]
MKTASSKHASTDLGIPSPQPEVTEDERAARVEALRKQPVAGLQINGQDFLAWFKKTYIEGKKVPRNYTVLAAMPVITLEYEHPVDAPEQVYIIPISGYPADADQDGTSGVPMVAPRPGRRFTNAMLKDITTDPSDYEIDDLNMPRIPEQDKVIALNMTLVRLGQFIAQDIKGMEMLTNDDIVGSQSLEA